MNLTQQITQILEPVILALIAALVSIIIVAINRGRDAVINWVKSKTTASQQAIIDRVAEEAHAYAEQWAIEYGKTKLEAAINYAAIELQERGISISTEKLKAAIQAAWQSHNWSK